jgi:hypothetical protein
MENKFTVIFLMEKRDPIAMTGFRSEVAGTRDSHSFGEPVGDHFCRSNIELNVVKTFDTELICHLFLPQLCGLRLQPSAITASELSTKKSRRRQLFCCKAVILAKIKRVLLHALGQTTTP